MPTKITSPEFRDLFMSNILSYLDLDEQKILHAVCSLFREMRCHRSLDYWVLKNHLLTQPKLDVSLFLGVHQIVANSCYTVQQSKNGNFRNRFQCPFSEFQKVSNKSINTISIVSPKEIISGSNKGKITFWDTATRIPRYIWPIDQSNILTTSTLQTREGRKILISTSENGTVAISDIENKTLIRKQDINFTGSLISKKHYIISGAPNEALKGTIEIRKINLNLDIESLGKLEGHQDLVQAIEIIPKENYLVSGAKDRTIKIWDISNRKCLETLEGHTEAITKIALFENGKKIISGSEDQTLKIWQILPDNGEKVTSESEDQPMRIWPSEYLCTLRGHTGAIRAISFGNGFIASGSDDATIRLWTSQGLCLQILKGHDGAIQTLNTINQGIISGDDTGSIRIWRTDHHPILEDVLPPNTPLEKTARLILLDIWQYLEIIVNRQRGEINVLTSSAIEFALSRIKMLPEKIQKEFFLQIEAKRNPTQNAPIAPPPPPPITQNFLMRFFNRPSSNPTPSIEISVKQFLNRIDLLPQEVKDAFYEKARIYAN